jgi:hypothetical protein
MSKIESTTAEKLTIILLGILLVTPMALFDGYVLSKCWGWILVPTFHLEPLRIAPAIGITAITGFLVYQASPTKSSELEVMKEKIVYSLGLTANVWFVCWILHFFM